MWDPEKLVLMYSTALLFKQYHRCELVWPWPAEKGRHLFQITLNSFPLPLGELVLLLLRLSLSKKKSPPFSSVVVFFTDWVWLFLTRLVFCGNPSFWTTSRCQGILSVHIFYDQQAPSVLDVSGIFSKRIGKACCDSFLFLSSARQGPYSLHLFSRFKSPIPVEPRYLFCEDTVKWCVILKYYQMKRNWF